ncbi:MAG: GNAT family N-acetyltransferase [Anaerolineae bacterium]
MINLDSLFALYRDQDIRRYFPEGTLTCRKPKKSWNGFSTGRHPELGLWATIRKATDQFIGRCGLLPWTIEGRPEVEVAYLMAKEFWGRGVCLQEAAQAIAR